MKAYAAFAALLQRRGIDTVFGLMGDGNMCWVSAYAALDGTSWHPAWHEAGAVGMADGFAAAQAPAGVAEGSSVVGVATVTMGPGLAQSLGALTAAVRTRRPVLLITAEVTPNPPNQAQSADQIGWVRSCGAAYLRVDRADALADALDHALATTRSGQPCVLAIVVDVFDTDVPDAGPPSPAGHGPSAALGVESATTEPTGPEQAGTGFDEAGRALATARAPVIVVGRGVRESGCRSDVLGLGQAVGAVLLSTVGAKGVLAGADFDLGLTGMMADPLAREVIDSADVVLVLAADLDLYNTDGGRLGRGATVIRVDRRPPEQLWSAAAAQTVHLTGEVTAVVGGLTRAVAAAAAAAGNTVADPVGLRTEALRARIEAEARRQTALADTAYPDGPNPWEVVTVLNDELPPDSYFVVGIGHFWYFLAPYLRADDGRRFQFGCGFALIGQALPLAIGAAAGLPGGLVVAFEGDGSMAMNLPELQSAVRFGHDLLVIVMDNRGYGSEYHKLVVAGLNPRDGAFDEPIDLVGVARAMGVTARRAENVTELRSGLRELLAAPGVRLLNVSIALSPMSEVYRRQHGTTIG